MNAADANPTPPASSPASTALHKQMSGQAALDLLLDPKARLISRVTLPEGLTVAQTLQRVSEHTGTPLADLQAAAADPAALGLPAYANGMLEGFLFPATYDFEPGDTRRSRCSADGGPARWQALDELQIPRPQRLTGAHQGEHRAGRGRRAEDMGKVARVLDNRLADGMPLQLDTTVNYANGKAGLTTTTAGPAEPLAVQHLPAPRPAAGRRSATRVRRRCGRCSTRPRATGASSSWSTPTPGRPGSR